MSATRLAAAVGVVAALAAGCSSDDDAANHSDDDTVHDIEDGALDASPDPATFVAANVATAAFQDVDVAAAAGYANTIDTLGCFHNPGVGGMGLHFLNESLMDATLDPETPEALVYELGNDGEITGLVAHEYIVPVEAWAEEDPPTLFDVELHQHPTLPLWVLHTWIWKDNPAGVFEDWNPTVRPCPAGVPVFGIDLP